MRELIVSTDVFHLLPKVLYTFQGRILKNGDSIIKKCKARNEGCLRTKANLILYFSVRIYGIFTYAHQSTLHFSETESQKMGIAFKKV